MINNELAKLRLAYKNMISRCYDKNRECWPNYGGRGIGVCDEWRASRDKFISWSLTNGHGAGLSLDRIDNNCGYSPANCRWATVVEQLNNQGRCAVIEHDGVSATISQWCEKLGVTQQQRFRAYKRHSNYGATTIAELFCDHLLVLRTSARINKCLECSRTESIKWRKNGEQCNTCYHRWFRASKRVA